MMDIRYPNITGATEAAQLQQIKSYLRQLVDQLNMTVKDANGGAVMGYNSAMRVAVQNEIGEKTDPVADFNAIKALIIKSADIITAYYEEINNLLHLSGEFVAESDFGTYKEETSAIINASNERIRSLVTKTGEIDSDVDMLRVSQSVLEQTAEGISVRVTQAEGDISALGSRTSSAEASIKANADNINLKVSKDGVISSINASAEGVAIDASKLAKITADKINLEGYTTINGGFSVDENGKMTAKGANIEGHITADTGKIGGWTINGDELESIKNRVSKLEVIKAVNESTETGVINASKLAKITAEKINLEGYTTINNGFSVDKEGNMTAKGANVSGKVAANEGNVGGWTISDGKLIARGSVYLNPGMEEAQRALDHHTGAAEIPADKLLAYDIDNNGVVDFLDALSLYQCATGVKSIEDFPRKQLSTVTVEIDPNNPGAPIRIYGVNMWGRSVDSYVSADPAVSSFVSKDLLNRIAQMDLDGGMHRTMEGETEWFNPPMALGVEYRTTERWNGSAVYTMAVDFGALPNNTEKSKSALAAYLNVFDIRGYAVSGSYNVPIPGYYAIQSMGYTKSSGNLWISTTADMSGYNAYVVVKYTK